MPKLNFVGFTLVELLVTIAVISLVTIIGVPSIRKFNSSQDLDNTTSDVVRILRQTQSNAMAGTKCQNQQSADLSDSWVFYISNSEIRVYCQYLSNGNILRQDDYATYPRYIKNLSSTPITIDSTDCDTLYPDTTEIRLIFKRNNISFTCLSPNSAEQKLDLNLFRITLISSSNPNENQSICVNTGGSLYSKQGKQGDALIC